MAFLRKSDLLGRYNRAQTTLLSEDGEIRFAKGKLTEHAKAFSHFESYDIFLSHAYEDARIVKIVKEMFEKQGFKTYVDWIEDEHLDRGRVSAETAAVIRARMDRCRSLMYLTSQSAEGSLWMPWELGYMDARTGRVTVAPILEDGEDFDGREYLGLYPYLDLTYDTFYVHSSASEWVNFQDWASGKDPVAHRP